MPRASMSDQVFPSGGDSSRSICAWCGVLIREGSEPISHGACEPCVDRERAELEARWAERTKEGK